MFEKCDGTKYLIDILKLPFVNLGIGIRIGIGIGTDTTNAIISSYIRPMDTKPNKVVV